MSSYNVIVVGAGPVGSTLSYRLAQEGLNIALLEKAHFPRVKPCGGGLDGVFFQNLPTGMVVDSVIEEVVDTVIVRYQGGNERIFKTPVPFKMAQRHLLDPLLASYAAEAGADLVEGAHVRGMQRHEDLWEVETDEGKYDAPIVVGADGAYSTVSRLAGFPQGLKHREEFIAAEWDAITPTDQLEAWKGQMLFDFSVTPIGYGWIFKKADHLNVGFGVPKKAARTLKSITSDFVNNRTGLSVTDHKEYAHCIPFAKRGFPVVKDGVLLVGDAAGMADPTTGAGISWGVLSSRLAAVRISSNIKDGTLLGRYQEDAAVIQQECDGGRALRALMALSLGVRHKPWISLFEAALEVAGGLNTYRNWALKHPALYRAGTILQNTLVKRLT